MKQNVVVDTKDGKVNLQFDMCVTCKHYKFCYMTNGEHHKGVPNGLCAGCFTLNEDVDIYVVP